MRPNYFSGGQASLAALVFAVLIVGHHCCWTAATKAADGRPEGTSPAPSKTKSSEEEGQSNQDAEDSGLLGALFGVATRVAEQATRSAGGDVDGAALQDVIEIAADGVRLGLSTVDHTLPPLDPKAAQAFGDTFRESILKSHKRIADQQTIRFVMPIWEEVMRSSKMPAGSVTITLVEDPEINAFAFVGKNVVVNRGFIKFAAECDKTREVIRFALAHELGHIASGHTDTLFRRMMAADKIAPGASVGPSIVEAVIKHTPINQASEREADCFARKMHLENGWSLEGGKEFLTRVQSMAERPVSSTAIESLFASHPDEKRRLELLESGEGCDR